MAQALVTGASGFVGAHIVRALAAEGHGVSCLVRKTSLVDRLRPLGARLIQGDMTDPRSLTEAVAGAEVVYHAAGCLRALNARQFYRVNEQGVRNLVEACAAQSRPPVVVMISSLAAAGPSVGDCPRVETDRCAPVSVYGRSKRAGEQAAQQLADRVPISIVRPPIILGEADPAGLELFRMIYRVGIHLVPGWADRRFSVIHVEDLVRLLFLVAQHGRRLAPARDGEETAFAGYYLAAGDTDPTYAELGRMIAAAVGRRWVLCPRVPKPGVWMTAALCEALGQLCRRPLTLNIDKAREATAGSWVCSPRRAMDELGFAVAAPLAERLRQTAEWYRREGWL